MDHEKGDIYTKDEFWQTTHTSFISSFIYLSIMYCCGMYTLFFFKYKLIEGGARNSSNVILIQYWTFSPRPTPSSSLVHNLSHLPRIHKLCMHAICQAQIGHFITTNMT